MPPMPVQCIHTFSHIAHAMLCETVVYKYLVYFSVVGAITLECNSCALFLINQLSLTIQQHIIYHIEAQCISYLVVYVIFS